MGQSAVLTPVASVYHIRTSSKSASVALIGDGALVGLEQLSVVCRQCATASRVMRFQWRACGVTMLTGKIQNRMVPLAARVWASGGTGFDPLADPWPFRRRLSITHVLCT